MLNSFCHWHRIYAEILFAELAFNCNNYCFRVGPIGPLLVVSKSLLIWDVSGPWLIWELKHYLLSTPDVNECQDSLLHNCGITQECINMDGTFRCECRDGFKLDPSDDSCIGRCKNKVERNFWRCCRWKTIRGISSNNLQYMYRNGLLHLWNTCIKKLWLLMLQAI